jgi:hypothetical protein
MRVPDSYIVRIYRKGFRTLSGVVEDTHSGGTRAFRSADELMTLLRTRFPPARRTRGQGQSRSTQ